MIRIYTSKIDNWEEIERRHSEWYKCLILPKLKLAIQILDKVNSNIDHILVQYNCLLKNIANFEEEFVLEKKLNKLGSVKSNKIFAKFTNGKKNQITYLENSLEKITEEVIRNEFIKLGEIIDLTNLKDIKREFDTEKDNTNFLLRLEKYSNINLKLVKWYIENKPTGEKKIHANNLNACILKIESYKDLLPESIFDYDDFSDKAKEKSMNWGRHSLLTMMGIEVCPYCQRNYITNYNEEDNKELTTADLDHFYPQAQYPYLALSLYNFIPSCHTCNSTMKNQDKIGIDTHVYPYTDSMEEDIKFTIKMNKDSKESNQDEKYKDKTLFIERKNLEIDINVNNSISANKKEKIENSLKTFKLREVYKNSHSKYVGDLIHNFQKYPKSYTKALGEIFLDEEKKGSKVYQEKLQILNDNFQEIIKKPYTDKIEKGEPLAKLTKDIMEELGIK